MQEIEDKFPILHAMVKQLGKHRYPQILHDYSNYTKLVAGRRYHSFNVRALPSPASSTAAKDLSDKAIIKESELQVTFFLNLFNKTTVLP